MKKDLHPTDYRAVVFKDATTDFAFLTRSTAQSAETITWEDGNEYPLIKVHISSASHPFFTGQEKLVDTEGRVDRFAARLKAGQQRREALAAAQAKKAKASQKAEKPAKKTDSAE